MTNREQADRLISEAGDIREELSRLLSRGVWNLVVRRAQEVIELALKALMIEMGVDYPKTHDVAPLFARTVRARGAAVDEPTLTWLQQASARLARARGPAFYLETDFTDRDAKDAAGDADRVMTFARDFLKKLRGGAPDHPVP